MAGHRPPIEPTEGSWIAGGAVRRWFNDGESLQDVDVFAPTLGSLDAFRKERLSGFDESQKTTNAITYWNGKIKVQLITGRLFPTVEACLDAFDFTICQFAWTKAGIYTTEEAIISTLRRHLSVHRITKEFALDSMRRAFKYQRKGFEPCLGTIRDIAIVIRTLDEEELKNQIELSPAGGKRFVRFD